MVRVLGEHMWNGSREILCLHDGGTDADAVWEDVDVLEGDLRLLREFHEQWAVWVARLPSLRPPPPPPGSPLTPPPRRPPVLSALVGCVVHLHGPSAPDVVTALTAGSAFFVRGGKCK